MEIAPGKLWGMRRMADEGGRFKMTAVDQRPPIKALVAERRGAAEAPYDDVCAVKALLVRELGPYSSALLLDPHYAYPSAIHLVRPSKGLILTLEDSVFTFLRAWNPLPLSLRGEVSGNAIERAPIEIGLRILSIAEMQRNWIGVLVLVVDQ